MARTVLARHSATKAELEREVVALVNAREAQAITIDWQFSVAAARTKLNRHYEAVHAENVKYRQT